MVSRMLLCFLNFELIRIIKGIKSVARKFVLGGEDIAFRRPGFAAYRATVDVERIRKDPEVSWILERPALNIWYDDEKMDMLTVSFRY